MAICDVDPDALQRAKAALGDCIAELADVSDEMAVERFFDKVRSGFGGLDALVNNAGIAGPTGNIEDLSPAEWRRCIDICLTGQFLCARQAIPLIKAAGGGALVNMGSAASKHGYAYRAPYSAAKFGVIGLTQSLAKELGPDNIRVNCLNPVFNPDTGLAAEFAGGPVDDARRAKFLATIPLGRFSTAQDVANAALYLASDEAAFISGVCIEVDGARCV